jgi:tetratricopeptide (TPR) repeat protein
MSTMMKIPVEGTHKIVKTINPDIQILIGQADDRKNHGDFDAALQIYDEVLKIDRHEPCALCSKGDVLDAMGKPEEAVSCYNLALKSDPCNAETWYNKGISLKKLGKEAEAGMCMANALSLALGKG